VLSAIKASLETLPPGAMLERLAPSGYWSAIMSDRPPWLICPHCEGSLVLDRCCGYPQLWCHQCHIHMHWTADDWIAWAPVLRKRLERAISASSAALARSREVLRRSH
jgi:hypothetical protein